MLSLTPQHNFAFKYYQRQLLQTWYNSTNGKMYSLLRPRACFNSLTEATWTFFKFFPLSALANSYPIKFRLTSGKLWQINCLKSAKLQFIWILATFCLPVSSTGLPKTNKQTKNNNNYNCNFIIKQTTCLNICYTFLMNWLFFQDS